MRGLKGLRWSLYVAVPIVSLAAWLGCGGIAVSLPALVVLWPYPRLAQLFIFAVAVIAAIGGLVHFYWILARVEFRRRGYRIMPAHVTDFLIWPRGPQDVVYEEFSAEGRVQRLHFVGQIFSDESPNRCEVHLPSAERWDTLVPSWARGRRTEIVARIDASGPRTQFVDEEGRRQGWNVPESDT